ncbi:MAG: hypothetical protein AMS26_13705 [Bacteroides sp. SM23_62]|nr:MAG: hypothetical protein AMS26_13705 [Bacteroides sp. SM23_62]
MEYDRAIKDPPAGSELSHLTDQVDSLKRYLALLDRDLYISSKDGLIVYGVLSKEEAEPIRAQLKAGIEKKITEVKTEIRKKMD